MLHTLLLHLAEKIEKKKLTWAIGGSLMLSLRGFPSIPNDIDIMVTEQDAHILIELLDSVATRLPTTSNHSVLTSTHFAKYSLDGIGIDVMANFGVYHANGLYVFPFQSDSIDYLSSKAHTLPICTLEDWYILYLLMPNREDKVQHIEEHIKKHGLLKPSFLEERLKQPLPLSIQTKIKYLLTYK